MKRIKCFDLEVPKCVYRRNYDGVIYCVKRPTPEPMPRYTADADGIYSIKTLYCEAEHFKGADE